MKKNSQIGFLRKLVLKAITFLQVACLKQDNDLYYPLTKLHYKVFFGKSLVDDAVQNTVEFRAATLRHVAMVMIEVHGITQKSKSKTLSRGIANAFRKNLLLEARV